MHQVFKHLSGLSHHAAWRKQLELLLDSTGEGIYGIDLSGRCIFMNRAGAAMLGYTPDEVLGRNMHYLMHHSYANRDLMPICECRIFKAFQQAEGCRIDNEVLWRRDGSSFPAEYASYPILENNEAIGAVVTFNDITERVEAQRLRLAAQVELERRVTERTADLQKAHDRMRRLSSHLNTVREEERIRIAREMHDELGSMLTAFSLELNALLHRYKAEPILNQRLQDMLVLSNDAMESLRRILSDLRPGVLDHLGLWAAAEHLLREVGQRSGLKVVISIAPELESVRLSRQVETAFYRILQEALNNTLKHAHATSVSVGAWKNDTTIHLSIRDDGVGLPAIEDRSITWTGNQSGFGLLGIEERVWDMGGRCSIVGNPGQGVIIDIELPEALST